MTRFLWGVYPYLCVLLFLTIPIVRMVTRPFSWSTRASGLFGRRLMGAASLLLHWGLFLVLTGHLVALFGGLLGADGAITFFFWCGLIGGLMVLVGSIIALWRRIAIPEVRAMSQVDDYVVHVFIIAIVGLALYQVLVHRIFGIAFTASAWAASLWTFTPQPELIASASTITKVHIFLALTFLGYFPFTKLVHAWTYPINYFVRPYQSMRTVRYRFQRRWELGLRSDKSWLTYGVATTVVAFLAAGALLGRAYPTSAFIARPMRFADVAPVIGTAGGGQMAGSLLGDGPREHARSAGGRLAGWPLYVSQCARCHGTDGKGDGAGAASPTFGQRPRDFTVGAYHFVSTTNGVASDGDLIRTIKQGLPLSGMPPFDELSDAQVASLVAVLDELWVNRPVPGTTIEPPPAPPATAERLAAGSAIFARACSSCHGPEGRGDGPVAASLPTRPANLAAGRVKAGAAPERIYVRVAAGTPPFMPAFRTTLSQDEIWAVVQYVETQFIQQRR